MKNPLNFGADVNKVADPGSSSEGNMSMSMRFCVRGVIRVDVNIQGIDLDQCARGDGWFADTHKCNRTTMEVKKKKKDTRTMGN